MTYHANELDLKEISSRSLAIAYLVLKSWLPLGVKRGNEWIALNPRRPDKTFGSFKINLDTGKWADFATGDKGGDLISLVAYLDGISQVSAAKKLSKILGVTP